MGRRGSYRGHGTGTYKGTYLKSLVPKTEEEKQAQRKQRRIIPKFDELFVAKDENHGIQDASDVYMDSLNKTGKVSSTYSLLYCS